MTFNPLSRLLLLILFSVVLRHRLHFLLSWELNVDPVAVASVSTMVTSYMGEDTDWLDGLPFSDAAAAAPSHTPSSEREVSAGYPFCERLTYFVFVV